MILTELTANPPVIVMNWEVYLFWWSAGMKGREGKGGNAVYRAMSPTYM
jgi:hypothetical protein